MIFDSYVFLTYVCARAHVLLGVRYLYEIRDVLVIMFHFRRGFDT